MPYAYLVRCSDDTYDAGSTWALDARVWQHNHSDELGAAYTRRRRPVTLVWSAWFDSIADAYAFEKRIQGWGRRKREALIRGEYDALPDLSRRAAVQRRMSEEGPTVGSPSFEAQAWRPSHLNQRCVSEVGPTVGSPGFEAQTWRPSLLNQRWVSEEGARVGSPGFEAQAWRPSHLNRRWGRARGTPRGR